MKAIRVHEYGGPEVLRLEEIPCPSPGQGQVLVKVSAVGVNPVDTYFRSGSNPSLSLPYVPGLDAAGTVAAVGQGVCSLSPGNRVYVGGNLSGAYAEYVLSTESQAHRLPDRLTFAQGAAIGVPYATAYRALFHRAATRAGEFVLVHGASGGVGLAAVQFARASGFRVAGTAGTEKGCRLVLDHGVEAVLDHHAPDFEKAALALTEGRGFDVIIEMLANVSLGKVLPLLSRNGRVIVVGSRGRVEITPRDLMFREADVRGMSLFNVGDLELAGIHRAIGAGLTTGILQPVIAQVFSLSDASRAHEAVLAPGALGKIVLAIE